MKVSSIKLNNFKRFTNLTISGIPDSAKLIIVVGPNGSGKSSLFDGFNHWYQLKSDFRSISSDEKYHKKDVSKKFSPHNDIEVKFHDHPSGQPVPKKAMYFRTAYRNDPDFTISQFGRIGKPHEKINVKRFIDNDQTVSENYQRLVHSTISGVYSESNDVKSVKDLREELIGKVKQSMLNVFDDLTLNNIGDPLGDGSFHFKKGDIDSYHYKNLSGGEKAAFDLLLDLNLKIEHYNNSIFFIDEPETHMHTVLQGNLIKEMYRVVPDNGQMWVTTHSLGIMRMAKKLSQEQPNSVVFLDFGEIDFDNDAEITPASIEGLMWEKFLSIALDDFVKSLNPEILVMCEGNINGQRRRDFDSFLYGKIFSNRYPHIVFVSGGSCSEIESPDHVGFKLLTQVLESTKLVKLIDRDDKSNDQVAELKNQGIFVTSRRHIEAYLFDDEIIEKLVLKHCNKNLTQNTNEHQKINEKEIQKLIQSAKQIKTDAIQKSVNRSNPCNDIKSARSDIYVGLKTLLHLTGCGDNADRFMKDEMLPLLTEDTKIYQEMEDCIINPIINFKCAS